MFDQTEWEKRLSTVMPALEGWCSTEKALKLVEVIITHKIDQVIEIGIYGGKSLVPMALAVKEVNPNGRCIGIDAWDTKVAVQEKTSEGNDEWWSRLDIIRIKNDFLKYLCESSLAGIIRIIELPATESLAIFRRWRYRNQFGLIHIDGNHSARQSLRDLKMAYSVLPANGIIVLDDINWHTLAKTHKWLIKRSKTIFEAGDYGIYQIKTSAYWRLEAYCVKLLRKIFHRVLPTRNRFE